jgi:fluoride exporter
VGWYFAAEKNMMAWLLVALGGGLGACARFALSGWLMSYTIQEKFPWPTFSVNVLGCLIAGALFALGEKHHLMSPNLRLFLFTGLLGGFTTFSAFGVETFFLLRRGDYLIAGAYVLGSVAIGLLALILAYKSISH